MDNTREIPETSPASPAPRPAGARLTALRVRTIKEPGRYGDGNGLYLVVEPSGARRWVLRVVVRGKRSDLGLGSAAAKAVSLADARDEAGRLRKIARNGGDPIAERRRGRQTVPTFKDAATAVHATHASTFRNRKHKAQWLQSLANDVFPVIGARPVDAIASSDVLKVLTPIWTTKPETARRLKQRIKVVLEWATAAGHRPADLANPVDGIVRALPRHKGDRAHHPALPYGQVPTFVQTLREAEANDVTKLAFEFLILTATRTSEVIGARWEEIDRDAKMWTIPKERIKAGREHRVPLSPRCLELLDRAEALADGGPFVFPGRRPEKPLSSMVFLMVLRRLKLDDIVVHGFRSSFRDWAAERTNHPRTVCEAALAHVVKDRTEAAYFRSDLFEQRRSLMETWARFVTTTPAKVLPLHA
jgi:integrase